MSLELSFDFTPSSPEAWALAIERRPTPLGQYLSSIAAQTWHGSTSLGMGLDALLTPDLIGTRAGPRGGQIAVGEGLTPITEDEFKRSPDYREGIPYQSGMSAERLKVLAQQHDEEAWRRELIARYQGGFGGRALGFLTALAVSAVDPLNFVPFVGEAAKGAALARFGAIGGRALVYGAEATAGTALLEPLLYQHYRERGFDYGLPEIAMDLGLSALAGAGIGSVAGAWAARRLRRDDAKAALDAFDLALQQQSKGEPIDVRAVAEAGRQRLDLGALQGDGARMGPAQSPWRVGGDFEVQRKPQERAAAEPNPASREVPLGAPLMHELSDADIDRMLHAEAGHELDVAKRILGDEAKAKQFLRLLNRRDSADPRVSDAADLELRQNWADALDQFDVQVQDAPSPYAPEQLRLMRDAHQTVADFEGMTPEEIGGHLGFYLRQTRPEIVRAVMAGRAVDPKASAAAIVLRGAMEELARQGVPRADIPEVILRGQVARGVKPHDAAELLDGFLRPAGERAGSAPSPQRPAGLPAPTDPRSAPLSIDPFVAGAGWQAGARQGSEAAFVDPWKVASPLPAGDEVDLRTAKGRLFNSAPEAETFARDIDPELARLQEDVAALRRSEALPPGAERELEDAEAEAKRIEGWGDAYEALAVCVARFAA